MPNRNERMIAPALIVAAALAASVSGISTDLFQRLYVLLASLVGFDSRSVGPGVIAVSERLYTVGYWCTPTNLWVSGALLLAVAMAPTARYLRAFAGFAVVVAGLMAANVLVSFALHPYVPSWNWGHIPGTFLLYVGAFIWCVRWSRRELVRANDLAAAQPRAGDPACHPTPPLPPPPSSRLPSPASPS